MSPLVLMYRANMTKTVPPSDEESHRRHWIG